MNSFYSDEELKELGLCSIGYGVKISKKASFYSPNTISIGNNVRIDDFCILSGNIKIGSNIHISAYVALYGTIGIEMEDFSGISPKSVVYSAMDDFGGDYLIGPIHPVNTTKVTGGKVFIRRFVQIGSNSVIFPNIEIGEGTVVGACSLVNHSLEPWSIYFGIPAKRHNNRKKDMLKFIDNYDEKSRPEDVFITEKRQSGGGI